MGKKLYNLIKDNLLTNNVEIYFKDEKCDKYDSLVHDSEYEIKDSKIYYNEL